MASVHQLVAELGQLISHTRRRHSDLRQAAEKSLETIRRVSENKQGRQVFEQLSNEPSFISPFLMACDTKNPKYCPYAIQSFSVLINNFGLPLDELNHVIEALKETMGLGMEIQLKILQCLNPLMQNYGAYIYDLAIANLLETCAYLQGQNRDDVVSNTAFATQRQLITLVFDKVDEADQGAADKSQIVNSGGREVEITQAAYDALRVFIDVCFLTDGRAPSFFMAKTLSEPFGLELLESVLTNHSDIFARHDELAEQLSKTAAPMVLRLFAESREFAVIVRVVRVLFILLKRQLSILKVECEVMLSMLIQSVGDSTTPYWKRVLCMETLQGLCSDFTIVDDLYKEYDLNKERRDSVLKMVSAFARIAEENPSAIGFGPISTQFVIPSGPDGELPDYELAAIPGISMKTSTVKIATIDQLDKLDPPQLPRTYLYWLVLRSATSLSEGVVEFITQNDDDESLKTSTAFVKNCWKEVLNLYETFICATTDSTIFHDLVKAAQKFTHSAGVLELIDARDAFMIMLGRNTIPLGGVAASAPHSPSRESKSPVSNSSSNRQVSGMLSVESIVSTFQHGHQRSASASTIQTAAGSGRDSPGVKAVSSLNGRNLLCCRALLSIGVSLGPTLGMSWKVIIEMVQTVDAILSRGSSSYVREESAQLFGNMGADYKPLNYTFLKILESTREYAPNAFYELIYCLKAKSDMVLHLDSNSDYANVGILKEEDANPLFLLSLLAKTLQFNNHRFKDESELKTWELFAGHYKKVISTRSVLPEARIKGVEFFNDVLNGIMMTISADTKSNAGKMQRRALAAMLDGTNSIISLRKPPKDVLAVMTSTESDIHIALIENLHRILGQCGSNIVDGWDTVLDIIDSVFRYLETVEKATESEIPRLVHESTCKLVKTGFAPLQLICNDFLELVPVECLTEIINILTRFCKQERDLNISFTAISIFWILSDHLRGLVADNSSDLNVVISTREDLIAGLTKSFPNNIHSMWIFALLQLSEIAINIRPQVRDGALQTLFRVFEAHGNKLTSNVWLACQNVVIPAVMDIRQPEGPNSIAAIKEERTKEVELETKEWNDTMALAITGLSNMYATFMPIFIKQDDFAVRTWGAILEYYTNLGSSIDPTARAPSILVPVYRGLKALLEKFDDGSGLALPDECLTATWAFWTKQPVFDGPNEIVDPKVSQAAFAALVNVHEPLYRLSSSISKKNRKKTAALFGRCAAFPALPPYYADKENMTPLQSAVMARIKAIELDDDMTVSLMCKSLASMIVLPFTDRTENFFKEHEESQNTSIRVPTYVKLCEVSMIYLDHCLGKVSDFNVIKSNGTSLAVLSALLEPIRAKFSCPIIGKNDLQLWQLATKSFISLVSQVVPLQLEDESWGVVLDGCISIIAKTNGSDLNHNVGYEQFDIASYRKLMEIIKPDNDNVPSQFWEKLVEALFQNSELYQSPTSSFKTVVEYVHAPRRGSTAHHSPVSRHFTAYLCIDELARLKSGHGFLMLRVARVLYRYICDGPLRGNCPIPKLLSEELIYLLDTLANSLDNLQPQIRDLAPLFTRAITASAQNRQVLSYLELLLSGIAA
ncbi:protein Mon2p [Trichomonascus vanleenenianus]|uniref:Mon2p n=1 Tax=Trichomonascus vanleenenianus TaxID=2268995 RepID=UPI003EC9AD3D